MLRIRRFEERVVALYPEQQMKTPVHLCLGQEAIPAGVCIHLGREDQIFSTHRSHGHCIAKGMSLKSIAMELYGRETGCCRGRGGSMHLADPEQGIPGSTAIVGGSIPLAVGAALSAKMQDNGRASVAFFGDGASEEGSFHESLNFAALHHLPVLFVCENNQYATSSRLAARQPDTGIAAKGAGYGIPSRELDGNDVLAVYRAAGEALGRARAGKGPTLLECRTWRWMGHVGPTCDVENGCRPRDMHEEWLSRCPLEQLRIRLPESGALSPDFLESTELAVCLEIDSAFNTARHSPDPDPSQILRYVDGRG
ncbi:MAG: thiamine pyrophosphate-dependent dehydrogenase E1 component subunit alpha [Deltaproteobacteria bacterium]|nr:thiamine pyrophosphate-dependent dehydrogenase E1 component subunit alpha [Deltaproteobacteria bacterium]